MRLPWCPRKIERKIVMYIAILNHLELIILSLYITTYFTALFAILVVKCNVAFISEEATLTFRQIHP